MNIFFVGFLFILGMLIPTGWLKDTAQLSITLMGLLTAGILPTVALLVGGFATPSKTPNMLNKLEADSEALLNGMILTLGVCLAGCVAIFIYFLLPLSLFWEVPNTAINIDVAKYLNKFVHAIVFTCLIICIDKLRIVVLSYKKLHKAHFDLARLESKQNIVNRVSGYGNTDFIKRDDGFGENIDIREIN